MVNRRRVVPPLTIEEKRLPNVLLWRRAYLWLGTARITRTVKIVHYPLQSLANFGHILHLVATSLPTLSTGSIASCGCHGPGIVGGGSLEHLSRGRQ